MLGFTGPKAEAEQIKARLATFPHDDLMLELSEEKTLITHASTGAAKFLGYEITVQHSSSKLTRGRRSVNGRVRLRVPTTVIKATCAPYCALGHPEPRLPPVNDDDHTIVATYGAEYRGLVNYYLLAGDVWRLNRVRWVMETSLLKTLARKHDSTVGKTAARYRATIDTPHRPRTCFQAQLDRTGRKPLTARFGGIPLRHNHTAVLPDRSPAPITTRRKELINRLRAGRCELCQHTGTVEVHHVGKTRPSRQTGATTPGVGRTHDTTTQDPRGLRLLSRHDPRPAPPPRHPRTTSPESRMIENDQVRFGRGPSGKGPAQLAPRSTAYLAG